VQNEATAFVQKLEQWLAADHPSSNSNDTPNQPLSSLDFRLRQLCLTVIQQSRSSQHHKRQHELSEPQRALYSNTNTIYAAVYTSLYTLVKFDAALGHALGLSRTAPFSHDHKSYFVHRCLSYHAADCMNGSSSSSSSPLLVHWLGLVYDELFQLSMSRQSFIHERLLTHGLEPLRLALKQLDAITRLQLKTNKTSARQQQHRSESTSFVKKMLRNSWTYLMDVLAGFVLHTNLSVVERALFPASGLKSSSTMDLLVNNTDFSLVMFALRACLTSLGQVVRCVASLPDMTNELNQLLTLLVEVNYLTNANNPTPSPLSLNNIICLDFVLFITSRLLIVDGETSSTLAAGQESSLWKYMIEAVFFCFSLQASSSAIVAANEDITAAAVSLQQQGQSMVDVYSRKLGKMFSITYGDNGSNNNNNNSQQAY
jgi:hypothetical protein